MRAYLSNLVVTYDANPGFSNHILRNACLNIEKPAHSPSHAFSAVQVRAVRKELDINRILFHPLDVGADLMDLRKDCVPVCSDQILEVVVI